MAKKLNRPEFLPVNEDDLKPYHRWHRPLQAPGTTQVDFEERIDRGRVAEWTARMRDVHEAWRRAGVVDP